MRILQVIPYLSPSALFGGSQRVVYNISRALSKRGHDVVIYTSNMMSPYRKLNVENEEIDGVNVIRFKNISTIASRTLRLIITPEMIPWVKRDVQKFDVAHLHEFRNFQHFVIYYYARKEDVPYLVQAHGTLSWPGTIEKLKRIGDIALCNRLLRAASKVVASARVEAEQYKERGVAPDKIEIIPNGIDLSEFNTLPPRGTFRKRYGISKNTKLVLYLGRIIKVKGIDFLIRAFHRLRKKMQDVKLVIVGPDDGYLNVCKRLIEVLGIEQHVLFTGPLYGREKLEAYNDVDVYVLPSIYEIFSITVLEAYACSKPVIATRVGDLPDRVIHGKTGLLVEPSNVEELSEALLYLLTDRKIAEEISYNARRVILPKFSMETVTHKLEKLYEKVVEMSA